MTLLIGLLTAGLSVVGAVVSVYYGHRLSQASRLAAADDLAVRFREPLLQSAHNLQSRLFNIARKDFLSRFRTAQGATDAEREYAVVHTVYLFAQYLAWVEIVRRESQYLDPRSRETSRVIVQRLESVRDGLADSTTYDDRCLRIFRGEQRAIGEVMLRTVSPVGEGLPRWECRGYADYVGFRSSDAYEHWLARLEEDLEALAHAEAPDHPRLVELQHRLVDLVDALDVGGERVPAEYRTKL